MLVLALCCSAKSYAQTILLDYREELLNEILLDLNDRYDIQISINSKLSNACSITINQSFETIDLALVALGDRCNLEVIRKGDVFTFRAIKQQAQVPIKKAKDYLYQGRAVEVGSDEPLPFAVVSAGEKDLVTDENGMFSFRSENESLTVKLRSLGYHDLDTTLFSGPNLTMILRPRIKALNEVVVIGERGTAPITNIGQKSGYIQLNDVGNNLVPGLSNNLIFNNLRQYPGIMAAGESIADFVIWGSYAGQNHVVYDGISLFNSWGVNDDMGRVNPYMIKHVEVYKGGYNVPYGDRVGGVVLMEGKSGNRNALEVGANLTNQLFSGYLNVPLFNNAASLQLAGRRTLSEDLDLAARFDEDLNLIVPKYDYSDLHMKFSASLSPNDEVALSTVFSTDSYSGTLRTRNNQAFFRNIDINSEQIGSSLQYIRNWQSGGLSSMILSHSRYSPELTTNYFVNRNVMSPVIELREDLWSNPILEFRGKLTHTFAAVDNHQLQVNLEYVSNTADFNSSQSDTFVDSRSEGLDRVSLYVHDQIQWTPNFSMQVGLKADVPNGGDVYWQPRVNGKVDISKRWNIHFGWGLYNQFISRNSVVDELGNRADVWQVANGGSIPVLESMHTTMGVGFQGDNLELSVEGYYKTTSGFTRYFVDRRGESVIAQGDAKARGIDLFARKHFGSHTFWLSYSLSKVEERFGLGTFTGAYRLARQDQRHELKGAAIFDLNPFQLSVTNVYGSGFYDNLLRENRTPYWRTDLAIQRQFQTGSTNFEAGLSILNLFNTRNIRLNQSINVPNGNAFNTVGIPFTPTLYFNVSF